MMASSSFFSNRSEMRRFLVDMLLSEKEIGPGLSDGGVVLLEVIKKYASDNCEAILFKRFGENKVKYA